MSSPVDRPDTSREAKRLAPYSTVDIVDQFERHVRKPELDADFLWVPEHERAALLSQIAALQGEVATLKAEAADPCYCCRGDRRQPEGGHPAYCASGCRCYGHCADPECCDPEDSIASPSAPHGAQG